MKQVVQAGLLITALAMLFACCKEGQERDERERVVVREPMELSEGGQIVKGLEPVVDLRWRMPLCFLAGTWSNRPVVAVIPCEAIKDTPRETKDTSRVIEHQTLLPPEQPPRVEQPARDLGPGSH